MKSIFRDGSNRGTILILTLGVLSLLALVATTAASLQTVSKIESTRYIELLEAKWLAQFGFERAIAELNSNPSDKRLKYGGSDLNENGVSDNDEIQDIDMDGAISDEERDVVNIATEWAQKPSFAYADGNTLKTIKIVPNRVKDSDVRSRNVPPVVKVGVSGMSSKGTYADGSNCYSLRVIDLQSCLYINDGINMYGGNQSSVSQNLKRILNELVNHPNILGENAPSDFGQKLIDARPSIGFKAKYQVKRILEQQYGIEKGRSIYRKIGKFLTVYAWVDKNVVNPVPLSDEVYNEYPIYYYRSGDNADIGVGPAVQANPSQKPYVKSGEMPRGFDSGVMTFRRGRGMNAAGEYRFNKTARSSYFKEALRWFSTEYAGDTHASEYHNAIYGLDELFPQYVEVTHRAPVNINNASEELLTSLITDVSGFFLTERRRFAPYAPSPEFDFLQEPYWKATSCGGKAELFRIPRKYIGWEYTGYTYDAGGYTMNISNPAQNIQIKYDGDEYGFLYRTAPIRPQWKSNTGTTIQSDGVIDSQIIAKHIIACRNKGKEGGIDYSTLPFGGEFGTWAQFYRFIDYLVESGIIKDQRNIFWNYLFQGFDNPVSGDWSYEGVIDYPAPKNDPAQQEFASYAIADAIKANFNPNMHLNETNPDENLWLRVDKTDLIVNSTEFCFRPMGYFEIESIGRILKPLRELKEEETIFNAEAVRELTRQKVRGVVKVFDAYRETTQRHFAHGEASDKAGVEVTNSGAALEIGPEVYNSTASKGLSAGRNTFEDNFNDYFNLTKSSKDGWLGYKTKNETIQTGWGSEYDGWLQLSTHGGVEQGNRLKGSLKGQVVETPQGVPHWPVEGISKFEGIHSHFSHDYKAHYHASVDLRKSELYRCEASSREIISDKTIDKTDRLPGNKGLDPALFDPNYKEKIYEGTVCGWDGYDEYYKAQSLFGTALSARNLVVNLSTKKKVERSMNFGDDLKETKGPYDSKSHNRIARSFRMGNGKNSDATSDVLPPLGTYAPSDLRIDGAYVERNSGIAYWIDEGTSMFSYGGVASMWVKPSFFPEHTGKMRKLFSYDKWHKGFPDNKIIERSHFYEYRNPDMFSLFFAPAHASSPYTVESTEDPIFKYYGRPRSNYNRRPVDKTEYLESGRSGTFGMRPASLFGGIYQHWASGSLDDWEHIKDNFPTDFIGMLLQQPHSWKLWGAQYADEYPNPTGALPSLTPSITTSSAGADRKDGGKHHSIDIEIFSNTPGLNHNLKKDGLGSASRSQSSSITQPKRNYLEAHKWTHVSWSWYIKFNRDVVVQSTSLLGGLFNSTSYAEMPKYSPEHEMKILVNGTDLAGTIRAPYETNIQSKIDQKLWLKGGRRPTLALHSADDTLQVPDEKPLGSQYLRANTFRIGESSFHGFTFKKLGFIKGDPNLSIWPRNYSGDFTVDEFYLHGSNATGDAERKSQVDSILGAVKDVYNRGRYYLPKGDAEFESAAIYFLADDLKRRLSKESRVYSDENMTSVVTSQKETEKKIKLLGVQWTWFAEDYDKGNLEPIMYDYSGESFFNGKTTGSPLRQGLEEQEGSAVKVNLLVFDSTSNLETVLEGKNSAYSKIQHEGKKFYELKNGGFIKYKIIFNVKGVNPGTTLLATPVFDDVTIFYSEGTSVIEYSSSEEL
ncbi:MAG: hypothetical protein HY606_13370 [Planctomycetes bacterium]|nr:hypothetical protein [Planctomycetota bacterium]